jgi:hypothetical protein
MKKYLRLSFFIICFIAGLVSIYYFLIPEKTIGNPLTEIKLNDSGENENYRRDVLAEHTRKVHEKIAEELKTIHSSNEMNLMVILRLTDVIPGK